MSVTSRKPAGRREPVLEEAGTEEPSHCRRRATATGGIRSAAKQKSMSLEDNQNLHQSISCKLEFGRRVRGGAEKLELHNGADDKWNKAIQGWCVGPRSP